MERESIIFYSSFLQGIKTIQDDAERLKAYEYIIQYGLEGIEPEPENGIAYTVFLLVKPQLDANNKRYVDGCKGGRKPKEKTSGYEKQKPVVSKKSEKEKTSGYENKKPNVNENDNVNDNENENVNEKENVLTLSKDNEEEKTSYGDEEINECLDIIKSYNNGIINGSNQKGRQYSKHLINKLKKIDNVKDGKIKWQDVLKMILEVGKENEYYSVKTTSPELIYYNLSTLMEVCRKQFKKQQGQKVLTAL